VIASPRGSRRLRPRTGVWAPLRAFVRQGETARARCSTNTVVISAREKHEGGRLGRKNEKNGCHTRPTPPGRAERARQAARIPPIPVWNRSTSTPPDPCLARMTVTAQLTTNHRAHTRSSPVLHSTNEWNYTPNPSAVKSCAPDSAKICSLQYSNVQPHTFVHYHVLLGEANPAGTPVWLSITGTQNPFALAWPQYSPTWLRHGGCGRGEFPEWLQLHEPDQR